MAGGDLAQDTRNAAVTLNAISMRSNKGRSSKGLLSVSHSHVVMCSLLLYHYDRNNPCVIDCPVTLVFMMNGMTEKVL